jgi:hypothetical protein
MPAKRPPDKPAMPKLGDATMPAPAGACVVLVPMAAQGRFRYLCR